MPSSTGTSVPQSGMGGIGGEALSSARKKAVVALFNQDEHLRLTFDELEALHMNGFVKVYSKDGETYVGYMGMRFVPDMGEE